MQEGSITQSYLLYEDACVSELSEPVRVRADLEISATL